MKTLEEVAEDLQDLHYGDLEIKKLYQQLRAAHKHKRLPYRELAASKYSNTIKYLVIELQDSEGTILITDLDADNTYRLKIKDNAINKATT